MRFLAGGWVEAGRGELTQVMENGLSGGFVADIGTNVVGFEERAETLKVAGAEEGGKSCGG